MRCFNLTLFTYVIASCHAHLGQRLLHELKRTMLDVILPSKLSIGALALIRKTNIPIFVHDLPHPWIEDKANLALLKRRPDPIHDLCFLAGEGEEKAIDRAVPHDLFDRIDIDNNSWRIIREKGGILRKGWLNLRDRLEELKKCPAALQRVTYLYLDNFLYNPEDPSEEMIDSLADVLLSMPNLRRIRWGFPTQSNAKIEEIFTRREIRLSNVTHLTVGCMGHFMVSVCPNVNRLEGGSYNHHWSWSGGCVQEAEKALLHAVKSAERLTEFSFQPKNRYEWPLELVHNIIAAVPNLTELTMLGELGRNWEYHNEMYWEDDNQLYLNTLEYSGEIEHFPEEEIMEAREVATTDMHELARRDDENLKKGEGPYAAFHSILTALKEAANLTTLHLPASFELGLGYDGGPGCGNAYMGSNGYLLHRNNIRGHIVVVEKAMTLAWSVLPHLRTITIGGTKPWCIQRDEQGQVTKVTYPWTDRVEEYLKEMYPPPKGVEDNEK